MAVELRERSDITLEAFRRVAWCGETVSVAPETLRAIDTWRAEFERFLGKNPQLNVYGVNIGAGDGAGSRLSAEQQARYLSGLGSGTSFGKSLPARVVRGIVLARLASFLGGHAAVRSVLVEHVAGMLGGPLPQVPAEGNGGSGEIQALGHLFRNVPRELRLVPKEPMALINGSPATSALVADVALRGRRVLVALEEVCALAADALEAPEEHFAPELEELWGDPDEAAALRRLRALLAGAPGPRRSKQALVSVRILPRMLGAAYRAGAAAVQVAETALAGVSDNPIFVPADGRRPATVLSNGSFHQHHAVLAIDTVTRIWADFCQLAQALIQGLYTDGHALPGQDNLGLGTLYMPGSAWAEDARASAMPAILPAPSVGQNDLANPVFHAWNRAERVERCLHANLALVAALASQSFAVRGVGPAPALRTALVMIRGHLPPVLELRHVGAELDALAAALVTDIADRDEATTMLCSPGHKPTAADGSRAVTVAG